MLMVWGSSQGWTWWQDRHLADQMRPLARPDSITLFTSVTCYYCEQAHDWLNAHQISWRDCPIESDAGCMADYTEQGAPGTPLVRVNGQWQLGFAPAQVLKALQARPAAQSSKPSAAASPRP
jgi:glutaredoxin